MDNKLVLVKGGNGKNKDNVKAPEKKFLRVDFDDYMAIVEKMGKIYGQLEAGCSTLKEHFDNMECDPITTGQMETVSKIFMEGIDNIDIFYQELENLKEKDPNTAYLTRQD
ncbi:MAG: hypothetical protein AABZ28_08050 [Nitrospinota bacterium]